MVKVALAEVQELFGVLGLWPFEVSAAICLPSSTTNLPQVLKNLYELFVFRLFIIIFVIFLNIFLDTHNKGVMVWTYFLHVNIPVCSVVPEVCVSWDNFGREFRAIEKFEKCQIMTFLFTAGLLDYTEPIIVAPTCLL
jgi:hypothetical protein